MLSQLLVAIHVAADLFWVGALTAAALILRVEAVGPAARGKIALVVYRRIANPAFVVAVLTGLARLSLDLEYYLRVTHWMHLKLALAVALIALHHVVASKARRMSAGTPQLSLGRATVAAIALSALGAAVLAVLKPF